MEQERIGSWMQTFTGKQFWPLDPREADVDVVDIAHALAMTCRYGGHTMEFYSVAEHSVIMSHHVSPEHALWALMHDSAEAYVGDLIRPIKQDLEIYKNIEDVILAAIFRKYQIPTEWTLLMTGKWSYEQGKGAEFVRHQAPVMPAEVHEADSRILLDEKNQVMTPSPEPWYQEGRIEPLGVDLHCWDPWKAEKRFMQRFQELTR